LVGTVAVTDEGWYTHLRARPDLTEVNFWRPSAHRTFRAPEFSPFLFKLRAPHYAICGFGFFARYSALPIWLAWETFSDELSAEREWSTCEGRSVSRYRDKYRLTRRF
jgi:putative restriction endonuclease